MKHQKITNRQQQVLTALINAERPQSAYELLDSLRDDGFRAPLQVYRALSALTQVGLAHKLESINAYVACAHTHTHNHGLAAFTICDKCGQADEFSDEEIDTRLKELASDESFSLVHTIIEMRGVCKNCRTVM